MKSMSQTEMSPNHIKIETTNALNIVENGNDEEWMNRAQ